MYVRSVTCIVVWTNTINLTTHIKTVEELVSRLLVLHKQFKILKNLKR